MAPSRPHGILLTLVAAVAWGTSFPANQAGLEHVAPGFFAASRFALASLLVLPFAWRALGGALKSPVPWILGAVNAGAFLLQYVGQVTAPAGAAGLLVNANVIVVAVLAWAFLSERPSARLGLAIAVTLVGASLIVYEPGGEGLRTGHLLVFLSGALFSVYIVGTRAALGQGHGQRALALSTFVTTAVLLSPFLVLEAPPSAPLGYGMIAWTAVVCTVLAYLLWLGGLEGVGATASAVLLMLEILVAAALGAWLLAESFPPRKLAGGLLVLAGIAILSIRARPAPMQAEAAA